MRASRAVIVVWSLVIVALVVLEIGELTRLFTIPIQRALLDPIVLVVSLVFTTIIAVIGAIFIGISITARLLTSQGFTPFEEEMLRMRADLAELRKGVDELRQASGLPVGRAAAPPSTPPEARP
jgi:hypothetical protein